MPTRALDEAEFRARLGRAATSWDPGRVVESLAALPGGRSSLTYRARLAPPGVEPQCVVVKVARPGVAPVRNRDVLRQARLLRGLEGVEGVRVPRVLFEDEGDPPDAPPFFAMTHVDGECFEPILDETGTMPSPAELRSRELDGAAMLARLHGVRLADVGLADEPVVTPAEEVERWAKVFVTVDDELRVGADQAAAALLASVPDAVDPVVLHGDFRLGNALARDGRVEALIDWEIWTVGDPRVDVSWYLMYTDPSRLAVAVREAPGMPSDEELISTYERTRGVELDDLAWFDAMTRFKAGAIFAELVKHNARRHLPDARVASWRPCIANFVRQVPMLLSRR